MPDDQTPVAVIVIHTDDTSREHVQSGPLHACWCNPEVRHVTKEETP